MSQAVIVFSFPEPKDTVSLGLIIESAKKVFDNMPEMKIHMAINEVADDIVAVFDPLHKEESNLVRHARQELALINEDPDFERSIIKAVQGFASYGHSGGSASVAIPMLMALLQQHNLSPLTNNPKEWQHHNEKIWPEPGGVWQNRRNGEAFSKDGGKTYYLLSDGSTFEEQKKMYTSAEYNEE